jgi:hypothetical protein
MQAVRWLILILTLVMVAAAVFGLLATSLPQSIDSRIAGWIIYSVGGGLIVLAYLRRKRAERHSVELKRRTSASGVAQGIVGDDPDKTLEQVRERIRQRKAERNRSPK